MEWHMNKQIGFSFDSKVRIRIRDHFPLRNLSTLQSL